MRPVERGPAPKRYTKYHDAIDDLEVKLGSYCRYCENQVSPGLAVEHKVPKGACPKLELEWNNFLLACQICNSIKGSKVKVVDETLWPDLNNTMLALRYSAGGFLKASEELSCELQPMARSLIDLVGLDRHDADGWPRPSQRDKRWLERENVWRTAEIFRSSYVEREEAADVLRLVIKAAKGYGFFSVWFTVFKEYSAVKRALIDAFPGTEKSCFDDGGNPIPRSGAVI